MGDVAVFGETNEATPRRLVLRVDTDGRLILGPSDAVATDTLTTIGQTLELDVRNLTTVAIQVTGVWTGSLVIEGRLDDSTWQTLAIGQNQQGQYISTFTGNDVVWVPVACLRAVRVRAAAAMTGTGAVVIIRGSVGESQVIGNQIPVPNSPAISIVTLVLANTEYPLAIPVNTRRIDFQARQTADVRWSNVTGRVAAPVDPYTTMKAGNAETSGDIMVVVAYTLYFASPVAGTIVEVRLWS